MGDNFCLGMDSPLRKLVECAPRVQHFCLKRKSGLADQLRFEVSISRHLMELISNQWGHQLKGYEWFPTPCDDNSDDDDDVAVPHDNLARFPMLEHVGFFVSHNSDVEAVTDYLNELAGRLRSALTGGS